MNLTLACPPIGLRLHEYFDGPVLHVVSVAGVSLWPFRLLPPTVDGSVGPEAAEISPPTPTLTHALWPASSRYGYRRTGACILSAGHHGAGAHDRECGLGRAANDFTR